MSWHPSAVERGGSQRHCIVEHSFGGQAVPVAKRIDDELGQVAHHGTVPSLSPRPGLRRVRVHGLSA